MAHSDRTQSFLGEAGPVGDPSTIGAAAMTDPALPGLGLVLDEARLSAWLGKAARARYVRHKPGVQLLAWVEVTDAGGVTTPALAQVTSDASAPKLAKLARAARRAGTWHRHEADLRLAVAGAAADRDLPGLRRVLEGSATLRYNPARRWVGRAWAGGEEHLVKVFTRGGSMRSRWAATLLTEHGIATPPITRLRGDALWMPWWEGHSLETEPLDAATLAEVGALLAQVHAIRPTDSGELVWSHGDFSCDQVLRRTDGVLALLDLDRSGAAPRTADLSSWLGDALARAAEPGREAVTVASRAWEEFRPLLEAYEDAAGVRVDRDAVLGGAALALRNRAGEPLRRLAPGGSQQRAARLAVAEAVRVGSAEAPPAVVMVGGLAHDVVRGWPRGEHEALLELAPRGVVGSNGPEGSNGPVARGARWNAGAVTVYPTGKDRKLPAFADRLAAGDAVVVHRPGRRAVLRGPRPGAPFVKVTRAGRANDAVVRHLAVQAILAGQAQVPDVVWHTADALALAPLTGPTLLELGSEPQVPLARLADAWESLGRAVAHLHSTPPEAAPSLGAFHDPAREAATTRQWLDAALRWQLLPPVAEPDVAAALAPLVQERPEPSRLLHRDLHEGQAIWTGDGVGLIDLDTAAWGEPALDVANVLAHLDLRVRQHLLTPDRRRCAEEAFLAGLSPAASTQRRMAAYHVAARLRLCGVYALRPRWRSLAGELLTDTLDRA